MLSDPKHFPNSAYNSALFFPVLSNLNLSAFLLIVIFNRSFYYKSDSLLTQVDIMCYVSVDWGTGTRESSYMNNFCPYSKMLCTLKNVLRIIPSIKISLMLSSFTLYTYIIIKFRIKFLALAYILDDQILKLEKFMEIIQMNSFFFFFYRWKNENCCFSTVLQLFVSLPHNTEVPRAGRTVVHCFHLSLSQCMWLFTK